MEELYQCSLIFFCNPRYSHSMFGLTMSVEQKKVCKMMFQCVLYFLMYLGLLKSPEAA
jgi:hypothetical protein